MIFKNSSDRSSQGFSLMEVLAAIAIFAIIMSPLFILQGAVYTRLVRSAQRLHRVWFAQDFLQRTHEKIKSDTTKFSADEEQSFPQTQLHYELSHVSSDSPFASLKDLYVESVSARWRTQEEEETSQLVTFVFKPQPIKQEKK